MEPCEISTLLQLVRSSCQVRRRKDKADAFEAEADDQLNGSHKDRWEGMVWKNGNIDMLWWKEMVRCYIVIDGMSGMKWKM